MEIPEVAQPLELGGNVHHVIVLLLPEGRHMDVGETESLQVTHLTQERSKCGQGGQIPGTADRQKVSRQGLSLFQMFLGLQGVRLV